MSNSLMLSQMGLSFAQSWGQYSTASIQAGLQQKIQDYRNSMSQLSAARSLDAVSVNEAGLRDAETDAQVAIQRQSMRDTADAEVQAAAAGVAGNNVDAVMDDLRASAGRASYATQRNAEIKKAEMFGQRKSIAISAISNKDISVIPKPSFGAMLLGAGTNLLNIYDSHQPEGDRILGPNGGRVTSTNLL